ncbi:MAG: glycoside hydrolase [Acidobacteriota bacterium]|nr:glycoside hydrolase [Acidobacteriota bacterium]
MNFSRCLLLLAVGLLTANGQNTSYGGLRWRSIGPPRGGRTVAIAGIPSQPNVYYCAATNGGVWKTTDFGRVWKPIFDEQPTGSIGALALAPSDPNIIYVGSGEGLQRPDLSVGDGIYKSTDAGKTWQHLGLRDGLQIASILVDPRDSNRVYVAVLGHPYGPNTERGVYRSSDGGQNWTKILYKDENTGAVDLAFDPADPRTVYAVMWAARQGPWENGSWQGPGSGLFKSTDGGDHWKQLTGGLPTFEEGLGRIGITVAPNDSRRLYALVDAKAGGLYRSDDGGESWKLMNGEMRIWGRGSDFAWVRADPKNKDTIYIANTSTYRSMDGGTTFKAIKGAPGGDDYHSIWINPNVPQIILLGSDQGATLSVNGGETWSSWYNQSTAQFYHVITDNQFPYWVYGGQQESGSAGVASRGNNGAITFRDWHAVGVEEYGYVAPDPLNPNFIYGGKVSRYDTNTGDVQQVGPIARRGAQYRFLRTAPLLFSSVDPHILYLGGNVLFKTVNGGQSWDIISGDLTRESYEVPPSVGIYAEEARKQATRRGVIYTIAPSHKDVNVIWAGTDDGLIHVTVNGGSSWKNVTPPGLTPWGKVSLMDASHFDVTTAYAAVNRIRCDDLRPHIYRTHDRGATWQEIVNGLPVDEPVNAVREDPVRKGLLYAGTERAVYVSFDDGEKWQPLRLNMPAISIRDIVIHADDLVAGTHGRGFWILDDLTPLRQMTPEVASASAHLFKPRVTYRVRRNQNTDTPLPPEEPAAQNPPDGAILYYALKADSATPVTLEIFDASRKLVRRYASNDKPDVTEQELEKELAVPTYWVRMPRILSARAGMHRFVWDLHYPPPGALRHDYPISAIYHNTPRFPLGTVVLPGEYTVKLTVAGTSYSQPLTVAMDPRVKTGPAGLKQQFDLSSKVYDLMNKDYAALMELRALRVKLKGSELDKEAAVIEGAAGPGFGQRAAGGQSLARLNGDLAGILESLQGTDSTPLPRSAPAVAELEQALNGLLGRLQTLKGKAQ